MKINESGGLERKNLCGNCKDCWYFYNTNCPQDNDLIEADMSEYVCDGFEPNDIKK